MMDFLAREAVDLKALARRVIARDTANHSADYPTEWARFQPGAPLFAIPKRVPLPWPFPMLVEFDDAG